MTVSLKTYARGSLSEGQSDVTPLVLLHAFPFNSSLWEPVARAASDLPILLVDLPGAGLSPVLEDASIDAAAAAVVEQVRTQGFRRMILAGISIGGYVAMAVADAEPEVLAGIGLIDTKSEADTSEAREARLSMARSLLDKESLSPVLPMASSLISQASAQKDPELSYTLENIVREGYPAGYAWSQEAMASRPDRFDALSALNIPSLVLVGEQDEVAPVSSAQRMADVLTDCELVRLPMVGHLSAMEAPEEVAGALARLYRRSI